jgi:hypothetical protein
MTPSKRPLPGRPLPSTSLPKALLKKAAAAKPAPPKPSAPRPVPKPVVATPSPNLSKEATAAAALSTFRSPGAAMPKSVPTAHPALARSRSGKGNKWGRRAAIAAVIVLLCVGGAWAFFFRHGDPIAKIEDLQAKMDDKNLSWDDRRALSRQVRDQERKLSPDERDKLRAFQEDRRGGRGEARLTSFFAKSPEEQTKDLDKQIDDMMKQGGNGFGRGGFGGGGGGRGGGGGAGGNSNAGRNRRLSSTPADVKAQRTIGRQLGQVYQNMLTDRASQRGITLPSGGPRG